MIISTLSFRSVVAARPRAAALLFLGAFLSLTRATAVVFDPLSIDALAAQADVVLHGTVLSRTCQRDPAGRIYTRAEIRVLELWKGAIPGSPFPVVYGGGIVGEQQSVVDGQVNLDIGEEIVLFAVRNSQGEAIPLGLKQAKFHVWQDPASGVKLAASPFHGGLASANRAVASNAASSGRRMPQLELAQLKKRVEEARR